MKFQIFSDLHVGLMKVKPITFAPDLDGVIVAGDICEGVLNSFEYLRRLVPADLPIFMVAGNHEFFRRYIREELALGRRHAPEFGIYFLENESVLFRGQVVVAGCTLWTDYACFGAENVPLVMRACSGAMNDHRRIGWQKRPWRRFRPQDAASLHRESRAFLSTASATPYPTIVVTHHAPHWLSISERFGSDYVTGAYLSDLEELILEHQPDLFVHGHIHSSVDYRIGCSRIVANPHGYGCENPNFDGTMVVEIGK